MLRGRHIIKIFPLILFFFLACPELVEKSMYTDGIAYAMISNNLANGIGSFWFPQLSETIYTSFHEHPPLVFNIQSLFFEILGDSIVVERVYAFSVFLFSALLIVLLWREIFRDRPALQSLFFVPLSLWLLNEVTYHFYPANILEPTMGLFTLGAVLVFFKSVQSEWTLSKQLAWVLLGGILLIGGTLCKGLVALFPLAFFGIYWLIKRSISFSKMMSLTLLAVATLGLGYLLILSHEPARASLTEYFDSQVLASIKAERTNYHHRDNRFYIIRRTVEVLIPAILLVALVLGVYYKKARAVFREGDHFTYAYIFLLLGIAASFPLAISPKQSFYYLLPSIPYFAIGLAIFVVPVVQHILRKPGSRKGTLILQGVMLSLLVASIIFTLQNIGDVQNRDVDVLEDIEAMNSVLPEGEIIAGQGDIAHLVSYMYRLHQVSIDTSVLTKDSRTYLVAPKEEVVSGLSPLNLRTQKYNLYLRGQEE